jgi:dihydrofolate reductase
MTKVVVSGFSMSLDGIAAGPEQSLEDPLGKRGMELHQWFFEDKLYPAMAGTAAGAVEQDRQIATRSMDGFGAFILGRNMFGPIRGPWTDDHWKGWWGDNPPWHAPTFILTHHARDPIEMEGGTTFHFVTDGIATALDRARLAAGPTNVKIGGGASTVRQYLAAGLIDELQLSIVPVFLGQGEVLLDGFDLCALGFSVVRREVGAHALHVTLCKGPEGNSDGPAIANTSTDKLMGHPDR